jgi:isoleucyl-tRNA synthetase
MKQGTETSVKLDTKMTPELESEGYAREISRRVQAARKKAGLQKTEKIELAIQCDELLIKLLSSQKKMLQERTNSSALKLASLKETISYKNKNEEKIKNKKVVISFNKI